MTTYEFKDDMYLSEFVTHLINNGYKVRIYKHKPVGFDMVTVDGEEEALELSECPVVVEVSA